MSHKKISMEQLIQELEKSEEQRGYSANIPDFSDVVVDDMVVLDENYSFDRLRQLMEDLKRGYNVSVDTPIPGGGAKGFVKKALRKLFLPVIRPMNEQQVAFNLAVVQCLNQIFLYIEQNGGSLAPNDENVVNSRAELYKRLDTIEKAEEELATRLLVLEENNK
ncbi:hypothetical protein SAMN04487770_12216 [Butyrivibrio sp. ob235]|uniref:hypothetical protein n=1 Tax=Butyrivibrio sp. ob235 TaxID=1761780 RepID=UPI0008CD5C89|nr:hypothetical protein [Butyrivibrio sp. ob235]SEL96508.1 hypothetical protein SAMN04487770_12216 [Butyrivibrio sp. ob235]